MFLHATYSHPDFELLAELPAGERPDNSSRRARYARFARSAVLQLPPRQRVVVELYFSVTPNGRPPSLSEIAATLGLSNSTVSRRLVAARRTLREFSKVCEGAGFFS